MWTFYCEHDSIDEPASEPVEELGAAKKAAEEHAREIAKAIYPDDEFIFGDWEETEPGTWEATAMSGEINTVVTRAV
jgi:hypothetical protein